MSRLDESLALHGSLFGSEAADTPEPVLDLLKDCYRQRGFGDYYPHMLVAMGLGEFAIDFKLQCWDVASLKIIVEEAGGQFTDMNGKDDIYTGNIITSNGHFHTEIQERLKGLR